MLVGATETDAESGRLAGIAAAETPDAKSKEARTKTFCTVICLDHILTMDVLIMTK